MSAPRVAPKSTYFAVFATLLSLTGLTVWVAFLDLGVMNTPIALAIAVAKATVVILWFMHVIHSTRLTKLVVVSGFIWFIILVALTMGDYVSRPWFELRDGR